MLSMFGSAFDDVATYTARQPDDAYLAGREPCDARARWQELHPAYQELAAKLP